MPVKRRSRARGFSHSGVRRPIDALQPMCFFPIGLTLGAGWEKTGMVCSREACLYRRKARRVTGGARREVCRRWSRACGGVGERRERSDGSGFSEPRSGGATGWNSRLASSWKPVPARCASLPLLLLALNTKLEKLPTALRPVPVRFTRSTEFYIRTVAFLRPAR